MKLQQRFVTLALCLAALFTACADAPAPGPCRNGALDEGELGVDCGGPCRACAGSPMCSDGVQNQGESGVDCGGPCQPCGVAPTCDDGFQNQGEDGVDCGGPCAPCAAAPTCSDGVQNQGESGVDCGGPCQPCGVDPTCADGFQNQGESGVDCGGPCAGCPDGETCGAPSDCASGGCTSGVCGVGAACDPACGPGRSCVAGLCRCDTTVAAAAGATVPLGVDAADVLFALRLNGQPAPTNLPTSERGRLSLRHRASVEWTDTFAVLGTGEHTTQGWRLIPGTYDVQYDAAPGYQRRDGILPPENPPTTIGQVTIPEAGGTVTVDVEAAEVTFEGRVNGQPAPTNLPASERGRLYVRHVGATEWLVIGELGADIASAQRRLLTGTYDYQYRRGPDYEWRDGILLPENAPTTFGRFQVTAAGGRIPVPIEVATVTFEARINGQPAPTNLPDTELGSLHVRHDGAMEWTRIGDLGHALDGQTWRLLTGTYDVQYRRGAAYVWREGILTPENPEVVFARVEITAAGGRVTLPLQVATVSFEGRIDGQPAPTNAPEAERGVLAIRHEGSEEELEVHVLGRPPIGPSWRLVTGPYTLSYDKASGYAWREGILAPENDETDVGVVTVPEGGGVVPLNINAATVTFQARLNGQPGPTNLAVSERGTLELRHAGSTDWFAVGELGGPMGGPSWRLLEGRYDLRYERNPSYPWREGILTPANASTVFGSLEVAADGSVAIPVETANIAFEARLNGQPAPPNLPEGERGVLEAEHIGEDDEPSRVVLGAPATAVRYPHIVGDYDVSYERGAAYVWREGILAPENPDTLTDCFTLTR